MRFSRLLCVALLASTSLLFAVDPGEAEIHLNKAKLFVERADWTKVVEETKRVTELDPQNKQGWYLLGVGQEKLGNSSDAAKAYREYLKLDPTASNAADTRQRIAAAEVASETVPAKPPEAPQPPVESPKPIEVPSAPVTPSVENKAPEPPVEAPPATAASPPDADFLKQGGISFGFSPVYKPKVAEELGSSLKTDFDIGVRLSGIVVLGLRYARGTVGHLFLPDDTIAINADHSLWSAYTQIEIPLNFPHGSFGPFMGYVPIFIGLHLNSVKARLVDYGNLGADFGTGLGLRCFVLDSLSIDAQGLYHLGLPAWGIRKSSTTATLTGPGGEEVKGSLTGLEIRLGLNIHF